MDYNNVIAMYNYRVRERLPKSKDSTVVQFS